MADGQAKRIRELTLMLMYLTSWEEHDTPGLRAVQKKELGQYPLVRRCWKGCDFQILNELAEDGPICDSGCTRPAQITPAGEAEAQRLLEQYGIRLEEGGGDSARPCTKASDPLQRGGIPGLCRRHRQWRGKHGDALRGRKYLVDAEDDGSSL